MGGEMPLKIICMFVFAGFTWMGVLEADEESIR